MGNVQVYERPPDEGQKKKKMGVYVILGAFVLIVSIIVVGLFVDRAPEFGNESVQDKVLTPEEAATGQPE